MYCSTKALHQNTQQSIEFAILNSSQLLQFRSNLISNPRRNIKYIFQIKKYKSKQNNNICGGQTYKQTNNIRKQLIKKTNQLLYNRKKTFMIRMAQSQTKKDKSNHHEKSFNVGRMTHNYFFGVNRLKKAQSNFHLVHYQPSLKQQFAASSQLTKQINNSKQDQKQLSKIKSVQSIVTKLRNKHAQNNIFSEQNNDKTYQQKLKNLNQKYYYSNNHQRCNDFKVVPTVMNERNKRAIMEGKNKNLHNHHNMSKQHLNDMLFQKFQNQQIKRPNTTNFYRKNSGGQQKQNSFTPW